MTEMLPLSKINISQLKELAKELPPSSLFRELVLAEAELNLFGFDMLNCARTVAIAKLKEDVGIDSVEDEPEE